MPSHFCAPNLLTACAGTAWKILPTPQSVAVTFGVGKGETRKCVRPRQLTENVWTRCLTRGRLAFFSPTPRPTFGQAYVQESKVSQLGDRKIKLDILLFQCFLGPHEHRGKCLYLLPRSPSHCLNVLYHVKDMVSNVVLAPAYHSTLWKTISIFAL